MSSAYRNQIQLRLAMIVKKNTYNALGKSNTDRL